MQHADYFRSFLVAEVNLDTTRLDKLDRRVEAVYAALRADSTVGALILGKSKQGSWAHRLIIRPKPGGDFDADFLLEIEHQPDWKPARYITEVYKALHRHAVYSKQEHGRKCRCVWLRYAPENEVGCHLDIVPFITLPDGRQVIVNRDEDKWEPEFGSTEPQGFTDWVRRRDELTNNEFRRVVRLMKYLRRERGSFNGVKSVILTTLLGEQVTALDALDPSNYANLATALVNIVEALDLWLQARPTRPSIANPNGDGTTFDHRWTDETYINFRDRIHCIAADMRSAYDEPDAERSAAAWQKVFGDDFTPPVPKSAASSTNPFRRAAATAGVAAVAATTAAAVRSSRAGRAG
jgi:Second Messenger Oligonucleotide or Dinucleotide Synthetase domain